MVNLEERLLDLLKEVDRSQKEKVEELLVVLKMLGYRLMFVRDLKNGEILFLIMKENKKFLIKFSIMQNKIMKTILVKKDSGRDYYSFLEGIEILMKML